MHSSSGWGRVAPRQRPRRSCFICKTTKTYIDKTGRHQWRAHPTEDIWFCSSCSTLIKHRMERNGFSFEQALHDVIKNWDRILAVRKSKPAMDHRSCYGCGSCVTYIDRTGRHQWMYNLDTDSNVIHVLCSRCKNRYITNPIYNPKYTHNRFQYKDKQISVKSNPRKGICHLCGRKIGDQYIGAKGKQKILKYTNLHHVSYDDNNPLAHTLEICARCHMKESWRLKQIVHKPSATSP